MIITFLRSTSVRVLKIAFGVWLLTEGPIHGSALSFAGALLGAVLAVTGLAGISLVQEGSNITQTSTGRMWRSREHRS